MRRLTHGTERGGRGALRVTALLTLLSALLVVPATASAADFNPAAGAYTANTTTMTLTGPGTNIAGADVGGVAVFSFGTVNIPSGVTIDATGTRPFKIVASGTLTLAGSIRANGANATNFVPGPNAGGAGGGAGSANNSSKGGGTGGGGIAPSSGGTGGGGFGGNGARGGLPDPGGPAGAAGPAYGNLNTTLQGGSGGAGGSSGSSAAGGGGGGGAIALFGSFVSVTGSGSVFVDGGGGAVGSCGASGGGSGGGIVIHGDTVQVSGVLVARGGQGGEGGGAGGCGSGGGGGGGRIAYHYRTILGTGSTFVTGGSSGVRDTTACCTAGNVGPDPTGAAGVVTLAEAASSTTGPATDVSASGATMNGTINPHANATKFHFDFGTTTGYGSRAPASDATVGSDNTNHGVSQAIGGLAPSTTYHYRLVAIDALGFTTFGPDVGFTTPAAPTPPTGGGGGGGGTVTTLPSTASISSLAFPTYTKLVNLSVKNLQAGSTVVVTCKTKKKKQQKKGCPYKRKRFTTTGARARLNLLKPFAKKKIPVGAKLTITITARGFLGKRITYTMRKRKLPKSRVQCLSASGKPGSCA
jgi:hypothetical protein